MDCWVTPGWRREPGCRRGEKTAQIMPKKLAPRPMSTDMDIFPAALNGLHAAEARLEQTAQRLSKMGGVEAAPSDTVDLASEMVNLLTAKRAFEANLKSLETADEMTKHTIDLLG
jgi:flagellar basal body rod protein FlgF